MSVETYSAPSRLEIDDRIADAKAAGRSFYEFEQFAVRSIPDGDLYAYAVGKARQELVG